MSDAPYTRSELQSLGNTLPQRGPLCPRCGLHIPQFADLPDTEIHRLRELIDQRQHLLAITELCSATGCSVAWAKHWVQHKGDASAVEMTAPCPYCGEPLITAKAQQCRYCLMDWHDPQNPRKLGTA